MRSRPLAVAAMFACLWLASGCNSGLRAEHEGLLPRLREPVNDLACTGVAPENRKEGCSGECRVRRAASEGVSAAKAALAFAVLPASHDPETESALAQVRDAAKGLMALPEACPPTIVVDPFGPVTDPAIACAKQRSDPASDAALWRLYQATLQLRAKVKDRTGVLLPNANNPCVRPPVHPPVR